MNYVKFSQKYVIDATIFIDTFVKRENPFTTKLNTMKKFTIYLMATITMLSFIPTSSRAETKPNTETENTTKADVLIARLEVIKAIDKTGMTHSEKKVLRKEVRAIKANLADLGGGVYLSVGAIIIIVLLLILLL